LRARGPPIHAARARGGGRRALLYAAALADSAGEAACRLVSGRARDGLRLFAASRCLLAMCAATAARLVALLVLVGVAVAQVPKNSTQVCKNPSSATRAKNANYYDACVEGAKFVDQKEKFNFNSAYVRKSSFTKVVFDAADFTYAFWEDVTFVDCVFKGGDSILFDQALMQNVKFSGCVFEKRAQFTQITFEGVEMANVEFKNGLMMENANVSGTVFTATKFGGDETLFDKVGVQGMKFDGGQFDKVRFQLLASDKISFNGTTINELNCHEPLKDGKYASKRAEFDNLVISGCTIAKTACDQSIFRGTTITKTKFNKGPHDFSSSNFTTLELSDLTEDGCAELDFADSTIKGGALKALSVCKVKFGNTTLGALDVSTVNLLDDKKFEIKGAVLDGKKIGGKCCVDVCKDKKCLCDIPGKAEEGCSRGTSKTNPNINPKDDPKCFPADATVLLESGEPRRMDALAVGDRVAVGCGHFSPVYMFTHRLADEQSAFVALRTASGAQLRLTSGHFLYVNGALAPASQVLVGDAVELASGAADVVVAVEAAVSAGLYNPQTLQGDVVVDGVRASTYTTAVAPAVAHAASAPLRWVFSRFGASTAAFECGADTLLDVAGAALAA
jgi:uncharacterized protein YjbI with pentapeptide repeats